MQCTSAILYIIGTITSLLVRMLLDTSNATTTAYYISTTDTTTAILLHSSRDEGMQTLWVICEGSNWLI